MRHRVRPSLRPHARHRLRPLLSLRRAHRHPARPRRRTSRPGLDRIDRQEPRGPRHLGADRHQHARPAPRAEKPAFWVDGNIHSTEVAASVAAPLFPAHARHGVRQGCGRHPRARYARVLHLPADQPRRRRMGARRQAEVGPVEHAPVSVRRGRDRGADRRGHRRRRPHPADAHPRPQRALEGPSRAAGADGAARSHRDRRPRTTGSFPKARWRPGTASRCA